MRKRKKRVLILASSLVALVVLLLWRPWLPKLYTVTVLPTLGGNFVLPLAINERGQVAGFADVPKAAGATSTTYHLFLWDRTTGIQDLGPVCQGQVVMNDAGQIAGTMTDPNGQKRAFLWDPNHGRTILPTLGEVRAGDWESTTWGKSSEKQRPGRGSNMPSSGTRMRGCET